MRSFLRMLGRRTPDDQASHGADDEAPPTDLLVDGAAPLPLREQIALHDNYPILNWDAIQSWVISCESPELQERAWSAAERAWLLHMRAALGPRFRLQETHRAAVVSSLEFNVAAATLDYMEKTLQRIVKLLDGIAQVAPWGKDILIVFDDSESYYRYVSHYYPDAGEFALSGGMHINAGCSHYATVKNDLRLTEPVIAHEMTHGCVAHLPLPAWLNEGLAVNVEQRLAGAPSTHTPQQLRAKHLAFWHENEIQEFWSGMSFLRPDDGNLLSYDLARLMVDQMTRDWKPFKRFVLAADSVDAGASAAREHLGVDLGEFISALLDREPSTALAPDPGLWLSGR